MEKGPTHMHIDIHTHILSHQAHTDPFNLSKIPCKWPCIWDAREHLSVSRIKEEWKISETTDRGKGDERAIFTGHEKLYNHFGLLVRVDWVKREKAGLIIHLLSSVKSRVREKRNKEKVSSIQHIIYYFIASCATNRSVNQFISTYLPRGWEADVYLGKRKWKREKRRARKRRSCWWWWW